MIESLMLCGIGLLAGCLLMVVFFPLVHERAVRLTKQQLDQTTPMAVNEIQADKDQLRAEFAMSVRRLEIGMEEMRTKAAAQYGAVGRHNAEVHRLQIELDKKAATILALRAREEVRKNVVRRLVKVLLFVFVRSNRRYPSVSLAPEHFPPPDFEQSAQPHELAATAAAIAALNLKRRQAVSNKY